MNARTTPTTTTTATAPTSTAPQSSMRLGLRILRATLRNMGVAKGSDAIRAYDAHAKWILGYLGEPALPPAAPRPPVDPLRSYEDARELALAIACEVIRAAAGTPADARREVIDRVHTFEDDVREALHAYICPKRGKTTTATTGRRR